MPHLRGITVHVTDSHGNDLQEWGVQYLRQHTEGKRVSAYVQSTTNVSFQVSVQPKIPFTGQVHSSDTSRGENAIARKIPARLRAGSEDRSTDQDHERLSNKTLSSPVRPFTTPQSRSAPDFAFLASLYLDGRKKPERKIVVYIDPADKDFDPPGGKVAFKHRWVQSADGRMTEHAWVFKEKAIETVFDKLMIAGSQANVDDQDDDALIKAMESSGFDAQEKTEKESNVGQIVVELRRIVLGKKRTEANYRSHHQEGQDEDVDMEGVRRDITHATGFVHKNTLASQPLRVVDYSLYKPKEGLYATFQFFYRSREQLQQFQFPGFSSLPTITVARTARLLNARMADLTPLSISRPLDQDTKKVQRNQESYETKVRKGGFRPDDSQNYSFGSNYRDVRAVSPSAAEEANEGTPRYPAAPLPFLAKAPNLETRKHSIPSITPDSQSAAEIESEISEVITTNPGYPLDLNHQTRPSSFTNPATPASLTAEPSSSPLSSTGFSKEQMTNIVKKDGYRPTAGDSYPSDQEEDTDDEHATESDLETHAGDDDFDYAARPEEEDEGYDSLQSQFKNVRIRKRHRDDVEDAENDNEAWQGADAAAHLGGDGKQKTPGLSLTEEERTHRGKKSRTAKTTSAADSGQDAHGPEKAQGDGAAQKSVS